MVRLGHHAVVAIVCDEKRRAKLRLARCRGENGEIGVAEARGEQVVLLKGFCLGAEGGGVFSFELIGETLVQGEWRGWFS